MSQKREALQILKDYPDISSAAIFERMKDAGELSAVVVMMSTMKGEGLVFITGKSEPDPKTGRSANQGGITPAGEKWLAGATEKNATGGGDHKAAASRRPSAGKKARRAQGKHKKVRKVQRRSATSRSAAAAHGKRKVQGWVLTADGAFWLIDSAPVQLRTETARDLVALVRAGADLDGLVEFIRKLDKGQA